MDHYFFFVGDIWPNLTLCVTGELWPFESIIDLRVWLGWSGASTVRWILQTAEACCFFVFLSTKNWSKSSKVLGFTGQGFIQHIWFFVEATPKTRKQQHGLCNDFLFFSPLLIFRRCLFFLPAQKVEVFGGSSSMAWAVGASSPVWRLVEAQKCRRWWLTVTRER